MKQLIHFSLKLSITLGITLSGLCTALPSEAAERITFIVPFIGARSITLGDLERLAEEGEAKGDLKTILKVTEQSPEQASEFLTREIPFDLVTADRILSSRPGEALLEEIGEILAPRHSNRAGMQALRAAILLSLAGDNQFTILELIEKYPTDARVNIQELLDAADRFQDVTSFIENFTELR